MPWSAEDEAAAGLARELFAGLGTIAIRRMFGGAGIYRGGLIFGIILGGEIYLKSDALSEERFAAAGARPLQWTPRGRARPVRMSYRALPEAAVDDLEQAHALALEAVAAARRARAAGLRRRPAVVPGRL
jgi:DNA transformation protein and related proteins